MRLPFILHPYAQIVFLPSVEKNVCVAVDHLFFLITFCSEFPTLQMPIALDVELTTVHHVGNIFTSYEQSL